MIHILTCSMALSEWTELMYEWLNKCLGQAIKVKLETFNNPNLYNHYIANIPKNADNLDSPDIIFLFDCHRLTESLHCDNLNIKLIVMQSECTNSVCNDRLSNWFGNPKYLELLNKSTKIVDYSLDNIVKLNTLFKQIIPKIVFVPFPVPLKYNVLQNNDINVIDPFKLAKNSTNYQNRSIDVLFVGTLNNRRSKILSTITTICEKHNMKSKIVTGGLTCSQVNDLFKQTKIVINIHYHNYLVYPCGMETSRIIPALIHGCTVLSEPMGDMDTKFLRGHFTEDQIIFDKFKNLELEYTLLKLLSPERNPTLITNSELYETQSYVANYCTNLLSLFDIKDKIIL